MQNMIDFRSWYESQGGVISEADAFRTQKPPTHFVPDPDNPLSQFAGQAMNWWNKIRGKGEIDWKARAQDNLIKQQQYDQIQQQGHPDDPNVRQRKSQALSQAFTQALIEAAPNASDKTKASIQKSAQALAQSFTMGKPILYQDVESMLIAVHSDPNIPQEQKDYNWEHHLGVMSGILQRVFQSDPKFWYNPQATTKDEKYPPGSILSASEWVSASQRWERSPYKPVDVVDYITKHMNIGPRQKTLPQLQDLAKSIVTSLEAKGRTVKFDDTDIWRLKQLAADFDDTPSSAVEQMKRVRPRR